MSTFDEILDEADEIEEASTTSTEPVAVTEAPAEVTTDAPAVEARTGGEPAPDGGTNTAATPAPITREDGATWSEKAQRWYKDGKIVAGEKPEVEQAVEATPEAAAVAPEAPKVEAPAPVSEPFTFRANGQKHVIEGLTVAPDKQELVRALLVDAMNHRQNFPRMQAEWKQKVQQAEAMAQAKAERYNRPALIAANAILPGERGEAPSLLSAIISEIPDQATRERIAERWYKEAEYVRRDMAHVMREVDLSVPQATQAEPDQSGEVDEAAARATLRGYVNELFEDTPDAMKLLGEQGRKEFDEAVQELIESWYVQHPETGEIVLAETKVEKFFKRELEKAQRAHQARETAARDAQKAKAAAAFNAAQKPVVPAPTPVKPKPQPATVAAPSGQRPGWDQSFKKAWDDTDDEE